MEAGELFLGQFWVLVRRAGRGDKRGIKYVLCVLALLTCLGCFAWWLLFSVKMSDFVFTILAFNLATLVYAVVKEIIKSRRNHQFAPTRRISPESLEFSQHRPQLVSLLLRTAVLADRAGAELVYGADKMPAPYKGSSRRRTLALARQPELWSRFTEEERSLLLSPEGSWGDETVHAKLGLMERVRVLRWVIQLDSFLTPFELLQVDTRPAMDITARPHIVQGQGCIPPSDLRLTRDRAYLMMKRCIAEGLKRGFFNADDLLDGSEGEYIELAERQGGTRSSDLLVDVNTVGEASEDRIRWITGAAAQRCCMLQFVIQYLGGPPEAELGPKPSVSPEPA